MPYQDVRNAIDLAFREHTTHALKDIEFGQSTVGNGRYMDLTIMTMPVETGAPELAMITIVDNTEAVQLKKRLEAVEREQTELVNELGAANKRFADMNEELQATNEELETNNEELQATNEELQTTNDELTARTIELHHLMRENTEEQYHLSELLERFPYYVMVVDAKNFAILAINPGYAFLLGKRNVIGQPLTEFFTGNDLDTLMGAVNEAARDSKPITTSPMAVRPVESRDHVEDRYIHSVIPILPPHGKTERLFIYSEKV
jgi:hypothetical protein